MKVLFYAVLAALLGLMHPASALEQFAVTTGSSLTVEDMILISAKNRGLFEKAGIDLVYIPANDPVNVAGRLQGGAFDAHTHLTSAWHARQKGGAERCSTMVFPFAKRYFAGVVSTTSDWKAVKNIVVTRPGSLTHLILRDIFLQHGIKPADYELRAANSMGTARITGMFTYGSAATLSADPLFDFVKRIKGVHVLSDVPFPIIGSGLFIKCSDLADSERRKVVAKFVGVLDAQTRWVLDEKASDPVLIPWLREQLAREEKKNRDIFSGKEVDAPSPNAAREVLARFRALLSTDRPTKKEMQYTAEFIFKKVPDDFEEYYNFDFMQE